MANSIRVVVALPREAAVVRRVEGSLRSLQALVGGDLEAFNGFEPLREAGLHLYINDDGRRLELECNGLFGSGPFEDIVGPMVVSKADFEGEEVGLSENEAVFAVRFLDRLRASQGLLSLADGLLVVETREELASVLRPVRAEHEARARPVEGCPFCEGAIT